MIPACGSGRCEHAVANSVLRLIHHDLLTGVIPPSVPSFAALHDHVDANMYFVDAAGDVPDRCDDECPACELRYEAYFELVNAAQDLAARIVDAGLVQRRVISQLC